MGSCIDCRTCSIASVCEMDCVSFCARIRATRSSSDSNCLASSSMLQHLSRYPVLIKTSDLLLVVKTLYKCISHGVQRVGVLRPKVAGVLTYSVLT